jgi:hypothetical protein
MPSYYTSSSAGRQDSSYSHESHGYTSSNRTYESSYGSSSHKYDSSSHRDSDLSYSSSRGTSHDYDSNYHSSRGRDPSPLHHSSTARAISPLQSYNEFPRRTYSHSDHRSVSPLGSSQFEQPSTYSSSSRPKRALTTRDVRETPSYGQDGYYGKSAATEGFTGAGLSRSNAVRRRENPRREYVGEIRDRRGGDGRRHVQPDFSRGDFSWDRY